MVLRVGIVGCGKIADAHVEQIRATGKAVVAAVCDNEYLMAKQLADRFGIESVFSDLQEMLSTASLDVVHIATPPGSHPSIAHAAMKANCHVFIEKPFADDLAQAQQIFKFASEYNRKVGVNHMFLFESPFLKLREEFDTGALGDTVHVNTSYGYDLAGDYGTAVLTDEQHWVHKLPGKLFHNVLDHMVCKITPFFRDGEVIVSCNAWRRRAATGNTIIDGLADELRFELRSGNKTVFGQISAHARPVTHTLEFCGSRDSRQLDFNARTFLKTARQTQKGAIGRLLPAAVLAKEYGSNFLRNVGAFKRYEYHYFQGMRRLLNEFYASIESDLPPPISEGDVLRTCQIMDLIISEINHVLNVNEIKSQ